jgi:hypothetical protein
MAVCRTADGETKLMASYGLDLSAEELGPLSEDNLITSRLGPYQGPDHIVVEEGGTPPDTIICRKIMEKFPGVDAFFFDKANIDAERKLHFIGAYDATIEPKNRLRLVRKRRIMSRAVAVSVNILRVIELIQKLRDELAAKE